MPLPPFASHPLFRWAVVFLYVIVITWGSLASTRSLPNVPLHFPHADKLMHFFMYGFLVFLVRWALRARRTVSLHFFPVILCASAYGILMEILQAIWVSHGRSFDFMDILANIAGACCFWWLARF